MSLLGQFGGSWFTRRENAVLLFIATSLPLFFLVGVSWPLEAIPSQLRAASQVFPSTTAIDGLVRINQMGASLRDVLPDWMTRTSTPGSQARMCAPGFLSFLRMFSATTNRGLRRFYRPSNIIILYFRKCKLLFCN
ncbi:MAG: ABC transporter permease [Rhodomicrobium sp.]